MKIFLTGKNGQLGSRLECDLKKSYDVIAMDRKTLDLRDTELIKDKTLQIKPDLIINAAAYTHVDMAEKEKDVAYQVNSLAPKILSELAEVLDIPIIHISTDYIFDGSKKEAYEEDNEAGPLSVYGLTKWQGEKFVRKNPKHFILRTSWVFSSDGHNFLKTIIKLAQEKTTLNVVNDQWGSPTSVKTLSEAIQTIILRLQEQKNLDIYGTYHVTSDNETNWYLYARNILDTLEFLKFDLKLKKDNLYAISSSHYPQDAMRPKNSKLSTKKFKNTFMVEFPRWENEVKDTIFQLIKGLNK
jgi:dTDP-4-dehydrorhamnose reductase